MISLINLLKNYYFLIKSSKHRHIHSILFICKGNICRSPFAERLTKKLRPELKVYSAGTDVKISKSPPKTAIIASEKFNIDMGTHLSKPLTKDVLLESQLVIIMELSQYKNIVDFGCSVKNRIILLSFFHPSLTKKFKIEDPYGKDIREFERCFCDIKLCLKNLLRII